MYVTYKDANVYYEIHGNGNIPILFLHGWEGNVDSFKFLISHLKFNYKAIFIDFPPFGKSQEPLCTYTIFDYAEIVSQILTQNHIYNPIVVAHSFGGRVALILANRIKIKSLLLTASAGIKPRRGIAYYFKIYKHKLCKKLKIKTSGGSKDYQKLNDQFKQTFKNIVNTHLESYAKTLQEPTVLFWGDSDKSTPLYMAKKLKKLIKNSTLIVNKNSTHFCYLENVNKFINIINLMALN